MKREVTSVFVFLVGLCFLSGFVWLVPPANDQLANATFVDSMPYNVSATTTDATLDMYELDASCPVIDDQQSVWWKYAPSASGTLSIMLNNAFPQAFFSLWQGSGHPLSEHLCSSGPNFWPVSSGQVYYIRVAGDAYFSAQSKALAGDFDLALTGPTSLPVELIYFDVLVDGRDATLRWSTASETDNAGFDVEYKPANGEWITAGFVDGAGNTREQQDYSYRIADLTSDVYFFRLRQIDFDGVFEYSPVIEVSVDLPTTHFLGNAYPNPFNPQAQFSLNVAAEQNVSITLHDVLGHEVQTIHTGALEANRAHLFTIDGSTLASGTYVYRVVGETFTESKTVVLQK